MNWYDQYKVASREDILLKQAGWSLKDIVPLGLVGAVILVFLGSGIHNAAQKTNTKDEDVAEALNNPAIVEKAHEKMQSRTSLPAQQEMEQERVAPKEKLPPKEEVAPKEDSWLNEAFDYIGRHEGIRLVPYPDSSGHPTIGIGHKILPGEDFSNGITRAEAEKLFKKDVYEHIDRTRKLFPHFDSYPDYVKIALLDGVYRGEHKAEYNTTKFINAGEWDKVVKTYLRNTEYLESKEQGSRHGVWQRMDENAARLAQYAREQSRSR